MRPKKIFLIFFLLLGVGAGVVGWFYVGLRTSESDTSQTHAAVSASAELLSVQAPPVNADAPLTLNDEAGLDEVEDRLKRAGWTIRKRMPLSKHLLVQLPAIDENTVSTGQSGGTAGADIGAVEAWDLRTDVSTVVVAVIDTGLRSSHEDLVGNLWVNPGEIAGNGLDDDGNGVIDDVHGFDAISGDGTPFDEDVHGTHVAGTIGATGNNAIGVTGVARRVQIMPIRFLGADGGFLSDAIEGITYAQNNGATILNNSWAGGRFSSALLNTIASLAADDILFVAAAGNDGRNNDAIPSYPASYDLPHIVSVAASDRNDHMASFSSFGAVSVDLAAPGVAIRSTFNTSDSSYASLSGTSMASPHVAGAAALLRSAFPTEDALAIKARLIDTVDPLPDFATTTVSGGRLNLEAALLNEALPHPGVIRFQHHRR